MGNALQVCQNTIEILVLMGYAKSGACFNNVEYLSYRPESKMWYVIDLLNLGITI